MTLTQKQRVLQALRDQAFRGVTQLDFMLPRVLDGGAPITRVAARIEELRSNGFEIHNHGRRHGCVVYFLVREPQSGEVREEPLSETTASGSDVAAPSPQAALFDLPTGPSNALFEDAA